MHGDMDEQSEDGQFFIGSKEAQTFRETRINGGGQIEALCG
jgi:hypothetical protein